MSKDNKIEKVIERVKSLFQNDSTGHDYFHTLRVYHLSIKIAEKEKANLEVVKIAALLHDVDDPKLFHTENFANAKKIMCDCSIDTEIAKKVIDVIKTVSFKGKHTIPTSIEGKIVQDADRIDALGAIGIARTFAYGGAKNRVIYDPNIAPLREMDESTYRNHESTSINHFYEKLLLLKDLMNTEEGKRIAINRHRYMEDFLKEFYLEWKSDVT